MLLTSLQSEEIWVDHDGYGGRPGQGLHQKDHGATERMDVRWQDLEARGRHHKQGDGGARGAMAVRRRSRYAVSPLLQANSGLGPNLWEERDDQVNQEDHGQRELGSRVRL